MQINSQSLWTCFVVNLSSKERKCERENRNQKVQIKSTELESAQKNSICYQEPCATMQCLLDKANLIFKFNLRINFSSSSCCWVNTVFHSCPSLSNRALHWIAESRLWKLFNFVILVRTHQFNSTLQSSAAVQFSLYDIRFSHPKWKDQF